jgi:hypothetical protein
MRGRQATVEDGLRQLLNTAHIVFAIDAAGPDARRTARRDHDAAVLSERLICFVSLGGNAVHAR